MSLALMLALQAAAPAQVAPAPQPPPFAPISFDLAHLPPAGAVGRGCRANDPAPIVVCARHSSGGAYPMAEWARLFAHRPIVAAAELGGGVATRAYLEQVTYDRGEVANRIMVGIGLPF